MLAFIVLISSYLCTINASTSGYATYYGGNSDGGACGFLDAESTTTFPYSYYAAVGSNLWDDGYGCGRCYTVTCTGNDPSDSGSGCGCTDTPSVLLQVMDWCPECADTHFDLNPAARNNISTCDVTSITFEETDCEQTGNLKIRSKPGTSGWWYGLHLDYVGGVGTVDPPVTLKYGSETVATCEKSEGPSFWKCSISSSPMTAPLSVTLTQGSSTLTCDGCITSLDADTTFDFGTNFGSSSSSGSTPSGSSGSTPSPTPATGSDSSSSCSCSSSSYSFSTHSDSSKWWLAVYVEGDDISTLYAKASDDDSYIKGTYEYGYYDFDNDGTAFTTPISFKVATTGGCYFEYTNVLYGVSSGYSGTANSDNCAVSSAYTYDGDNDTDNTNDIGLIMGIIAGALIVIVIIVIGVCLMKRRKKGHEQMFDETIDGPEDIEKNEESPDNEDSEKVVVNTNKEEEEEEEELETITTTME